MVSCAQIMWLDYRLLFGKWIFSWRCAWVMAIFWSNILFEELTFKFWISISFGIWKITKMREALSVQLVGKRSNIVETADTSLEQSFSQFREAIYWTKINHSGRLPWKLRTPKTFKFVTWCYSWDTLIPKRPKVQWEHRGTHLQLRRQSRKRF